MDKWSKKWSNFITGKTCALLCNTTGTYPIEGTSIGLLTAKMQSVTTIRIYLAAYPLNARLNCATKLHRFAYLSFFLNWVNWQDITEQRLSRLKKRTKYFSLIKVKLKHRYFIHKFLLDSRNYRYFSPDKFFSSNPREDTGWYCIFNKPHCI